MPQDPADILENMAATFRHRNMTYGANYRTLGHVLAALFPNGVDLRTPEDHTRFHFMVLIVVKLTRFTNSGMTHQDSIHDTGVLSAMLESTLTLPPDIRI